VNILETLIGISCFAKIRLANSNFVGMWLAIWLFVWNWLDIQDLWRCDWLLKVLKEILLAIESFKGDVIGYWKF